MTKSIRTKPLVHEAANLLDTIDAIRLLLPTSTVIKGGGLNQLEGFIFPEEEDLIKDAVPKRRREFIAGRIYARQALSELGHPPGPIVKNSCRAPLWPDGFVGAISHTHALCAAVVGRAADIASIGVDLEDDTELEPELIPIICDPSELRGRSGIETSIAIDLPKLVFIAKEALYKLYNPITRYFLDFLDVNIVVNPISKTFEAYLTNERVPSFLGQRHVGGRFGQHAGTLFAVAWVPIEAAKPHY